MANKKFSEFTLKTSTSDVDFVVGYDGTDNVRIAPTNLAPVTSVNSLTGAVSLGLTELDDVGSDGTNGQVLTTNGSGSFTFQDAGGGGATDLNGLSDVLIQSSNSNAYFIDIPTDTTGGGSGFYANNLFIGNNTGQSITTTGKNTLIGNDQFTGLTTGNQNVGVGFAAGKYCGSQAQYNVFIGEAGHSANYNTGGWPKSNVAIGHNAGAYGRNFEFSVFVGRQAGFYASASDFNTAIGYNSLAGGFNVGSSTQKVRNTCVGANAGKVIAQGNDNTVIGYDAGITITTGNNNTLIGANSTASAVGVNNEITLGDSNVTSLRCAVTSITSLSDERDKSEIKDLEYGLAFIDALQPREFVWDNRPEIKKTPIRDEEENIVTDEDGNVTYEETEFYSANKGKKDFGFIAQEVRELDNDTLRLVYSENEDKLEMSYGKLVPILVKAVQELKAEVELLKG